MKQIFEKPELKLIKMELTDVITTSGPMEDGGIDTAAGYGAVQNLGFDGGLGQPMQ